MRATILADASYCPNHHVGGWGYWIASDRRPQTAPEGRRGGGGELRHVTSNNTAEMMAIVNAIYVAWESGLVQHGDFVLVQSDSLSAIGAFEGKRDCHDVDQQDVLVAYHRLLEGTKVVVTFRHVKGHTNRNTHTDARFGANRMCDQRARRHMQNARKRKGADNAVVPQD